MIGENIKYYRKAKRISQEELAVKLNVVRQTVSKWEKGLSVPDADVLVRMAGLLGVSVSQLLGTETDDCSTIALSEELSKVNQQLAEKCQKEKLLLQANKKRGQILTLSFLSMIIALSIDKEAVSILLVGICMVIAVAILYRNLALLTRITTDDLKVGILRITTIFNVSILLTGIVFAILVGCDFIVFSENGEKMFAIAIVSSVMIFAGIVCPKLPYNRHTGLRLPWTVQDEDTWNVAHRTIGYISLPIALLYIACTWTVSNFELITLGAIILWIGIPGGISYLFFYKKCMSTNHDRLIYR